MQRTYEAWSTRFVSVNETPGSMTMFLESGTISSAKVVRSARGGPKVVLNVEITDPDSFETQSLSVFIPWELANKISEAYEHELTGLAHEATL